MDLKLICNNDEISYNGMIDLVPFSFYGTIFFFDNIITKPQSVNKKWANRFFAPNNIVVYKNIYNG